MAAELVAITDAEVRDSVAIAKEHGERFFEQIVWQVEHEVWTVLGYGSWDEMRQAEYGDLGVVAPRADRPELVSRLRARGLTQRQIAETVGVHEATVSRELASASSAPVTITNSRGQQRPASYAPRVAEPEPEPADEVDAAVAEWPDLAYYAETRPARDVLYMAGDLRKFAERGDLEERLDNLRRATAVDRAKRDGTYREGTTAVMGDDGVYRMQPLTSDPVTVTTHTCPTCNGSGVIKE